MNTFGSFFSGGGGADVGAVAAGWQPLFANEYDQRIAAVYVQNLGDHMVAGNLLDLDVRSFPRVRWFHASPPCPNFSTAKTDAEETANDLALAKQTAAYIVHHLPDLVTIENVYGYRNSKSWRIIARAFQNHGYLFNYWHVCMADYGVPQTRHRMIAIARRDGVMPQLPPATHAKNPQPTLFGDGLRWWVGWYEATKHLPLGEKWQPVERVACLYPQQMPYIALVNTKDTNFGSKPRIVFSEKEPSFSITVQYGLCGVIIYKDGEHYRTTARHQARFQSFPDGYQLPESNSLACRIIGNAVPPLFMQRMGEFFTS